MASKAFEFALSNGAISLGLELEPEQLARLLAFARLLAKWNRVYNLTAIREGDVVVTHHLLDCLAIIAPLQRELRHLRELSWSPPLPGEPDSGGIRSEATRLLDVGSGGGLPGAVIAIACPEIRVTCVDAVGKKTAFVRQVAAEIALTNLHATHRRVEDVHGTFDVVVSRAFATLEEFFAASLHVLAPSGIWLAMKARMTQGELAGAASVASVFHVEQLTVPGVGAERCAVWAKRKTRTEATLKTESASRRLRKP
ncbi:MAG: 16S rRNA (guanine(527)-N(7))-methyltransferase RsmG [Variovorax sp.]